MTRFTGFFSNSSSSFNSSEDLNIKKIDSAQTLKQGYYILDSSNGSFIINLDKPKEKAFWKFYTPFDSIKSDNITISTNNGSFNNEQGIFLNEDLIVDTHLTEVTIINEGDDIYYLTVTDKSVGNLSQGLKVSPSVSNLNNQQANKNEVLLIDSMSNEVTVTSPTNPVTNDVFGVSDVVGNANTNNITITFGSQNLHSNPNTYIINNDNGVAFFQYVNNSVGWINI